MGMVRSKMAALLLRAGAGIMLASVPLVCRAQISFNKLSASEIQAHIGFTQLVNRQVPLNLTFTRSNGSTATLGQYVNGKVPSILVMPFYKCKAGCTLEMHALVSDIDSMHLIPGKDYQILTVSINPYETPALAGQIKTYYGSQIKTPGATAAWHFFTGTEPNIVALGEAVGYHWVQDLKNQAFNHPTGIILLTPKGRIYRYFYGTDYNSHDLQIALTKAGDNQTGTVVQQILSYCCTWNPTTGHYGLVLYRLLWIACSATVAIIVLGVGTLLFLERRIRRIKGRSLIDNNSGTPHAV